MALSGFVPPVLEWSRNGQKEQWKLFKQQFQLYLRASGNNTKEEGDKVAILLTVGGTELLKVFNSFELELSDAGTTVEAVMAKMDGYFQPKINEVVERFVFQSCKQTTDESGEAFIGRLLNLARSCNFEDGEKEKAVRDQFVFGCQSGTLRERLFMEEKLTLGSLKKIVQTYDSTKEHMQTFKEHGGNECDSVKSLSHNRKVEGSFHTSASTAKFGKGAHPVGGNMVDCKFCGQQHVRSKQSCPAFGKTCRVCSGWNHFGKMCRSKKKEPETTKTPRVKTVGLYKDVSETELVTCMSTCCECHGSTCKGLKACVCWGQQKSDLEEVLSVTGRKHEPPLFVNVRVAGTTLSMEVDTGSSISVIPSSVYKSMLSHVPLLPCKSVLQSFTGESVPADGILKADVEYKGQTATLELYILAQSKHILLGRDWLGTFKLDWKEIFGNVSVHSDSVCVSSATGKYAGESMRTPQRGVTSPNQYTDTVSMSSSGGTIETGAQRSVREINRNMEPHLVGVSRDVERVLERHASLFDGKLGLLKGVKADIELLPEAKPVFTRPYRVPYALRPAVDKELDRLVTTGVLSRIEWSEWGTGVVPVPKKNGGIRLCGNYKVTVNPNLKPMAPPNINIEDLLADLAGGVLFSTLDLSSAYSQIELNDHSKKILSLSTHRGVFQQNRLVFGVSSSPTIFMSCLERVLQGLPKVRLYLDDILVTGASPQEHHQNLERVLARLEDAGLKVNKEKSHFGKEAVEYLGFRIDAQGLHKLEAKFQALLQMQRPEDVSTLRSFLGLVNYYRRYVRNLAEILAPLTTLLEKGKSFVWSEQAEAAFVKAKSALAESGFLVHFDPKLPIIVACDASPVGVGSVISHVMPDGQERPIQFASRSLSSAEKNYSQLERENLAVIFGLKRFYPYVFGRKFTLVTDNKPLAQILTPNRNQPIIAAERIQRWAVYLSGFDFTVQCKKGTDNGNADGLSRLPVGICEQEEEACVAQVLKTSVLPVSCEQIREMTTQDSLLSKCVEYTQKGWPEKLYERGEDSQPFFVRRHELTVDQGVLLWGTRVVVPESCRSEILEELHSGHVGIVKMKALARSYVWWPNMDKAIERMAGTCDACQRGQADPAKAPLHPWIPASGPWERIHVDYAGPVDGKMLLVVVDAFSKWPEVFVQNSSTSESTIANLRTLFSRQGCPKLLVSDNATCFRSQEFQSFMDRLGVTHKFSPPYHPSTNGQAERLVQSVKAALRAERRQGKSIQHCLDTFLLAYRTCVHATTGKTPAEKLMNRTLRTRLDAIRPTPRTQVEADVKEVREFVVGDAVWVRDYVHADKWVPGVVNQRRGPLTYQIEVGTASWHRHVDQIRNRVLSDNQGQSNTAEPQTESGEVQAWTIAPKVNAEASAGMDDSRVIAGPPALQRSARTCRKPARFQD